MSVLVYSVILPACSWHSPRSISPSAAPRAPGGTACERGGKKNRKSLFCLFLVSLESLAHFLEASTSIHTLLFFFLRLLNPISVQLQRGAALSIANLPCLAVGALLFAVLFSFLFECFSALLNTGVAKSCRTKQGGF